MINQSKLFQTNQRNLKSDISRKMGKTHRVKKKMSLDVKDALWS